MTRRSRRVDCTAGAFPRGKIKVVYLDDSMEGRGKRKSGTRN